MILSVDVH